MGRSSWESGVVNVQRRGVISRHLVWLTATSRLADYVACHAHCGVPLHITCPLHGLISGYDSSSLEHADANLIILCHIAERATAGGREREYRAACRRGWSGRHLGQQSCRERTEVNSVRVEWDMSTKK